MYNVAPINHTLMNPDTRKMIINIVIVLKCLTFAFHLNVITEMH